MNSMSPEVTLNRISPELRPLLSTMVRNGKVGLDSTSCLRITDLKSGCTSLTVGPCCDRFKLHIPYAGETLKCTVKSVKVRYVGHSSSSAPNSGEALPHFVIDET
ncbi:BRCA1-A complex subunit BRE [Acipenser ruthenus]|uniref:BRISC and BRCA1-A complex member 2 n=1 Tax=Acipenser ruthenus TaxID=7906 RepID=A0A444U525_ACIRT|nr:BRCA1-A complex subunit BRE [Acipenser ruthenus]